MANGVLSPGDWLQAVLSALAILAGFGGIWVQNRWDKARARAERTRSTQEHGAALRRLLVSLTKALEELVDDFGQDMGDIRYRTKELAVILNRLRPYQAFLRSFDITSIASVSLWVSWADLKSEMDGSVEEWTRVSTQPVVPDAKSATPTESEDDEDDEQEDDYDYDSFTDAVRSLTSMREMAAEIAMELPSLYPDAELTNEE